MARLFPLTLGLNLSSSSFYFLGSFPTNANHPLRRHQPRPCYLYLKPRYLKCCLSSSFRRPRPDGDGNRIGFVQRLSRWMMLYCDFMPGGRWWHFPHHFQDQKEEASESGETNVVTTLSALQRMWQLFENDRWVFFAGLITLILAALSEISIPHFLAASIFSAQSMETMMFQRNTRILVLLCFTSGICSGCHLDTQAIIVSVDLLQYLHQQEVENLDGDPWIKVMRMREKLYLSLLLQDISVFDTETVGDLTSRLGADCQQVSRVIGNDLNLILRNMLQGLGALIYLFMLSWPLASATVLICSAFSAVVFFYGRYQKSAAKFTQEFSASANEVAQEAFSMIRTIRVYGTEENEFERYKQWLKKLADISLRQSLAYGFWTLSFNTFYHATQVIAVLVGGIFVMAGSLSVEKLTKFILYAEWLIYSTWFVGDNWASLMQSIGASGKVFQLMDLHPSSQFLSQGRKLQRLKGHIKFVDVCFHYPSRTKVPVLQDVNLSFYPNEVVAIVGRSGSGKSTLLHLLLRLYEPASGQILIDGFPIRELDVKWLRGNFGFVGQEPRLFRMDVSSNIRYGCTRKISHADVEVAAKQAYAHDFILSLPNGYETLVDNDLLSGGQKQRIAIARALLRNPAILIFDEATSALDADSEHYVKRIFDAVKEGSNKKRTVIVLAHRLSTIRNADRIVLMDSGKIVQMGNHMELRKGGLYAELLKRQEDELSP